VDGIYIAAILVTFLSVVTIGGVLLWKSPRKEYPLLVLAFLLLVPMSPMAFYLVRLPLDGWLQGLLGRTTETYELLSALLYAPITEEPIKLLILLIPWFLSRLDSKNTIRLAMAIGLGFGVGEIWLLATELAKNPRIASLPWYMLGGYMHERFMVCVMHGVFTAVALRHVRKALIRGVLGAMLLHCLLNSPIYLAIINFGGFGVSAWQMILTIWVQFYFLAMLGLLAYFSFGSMQNLSLFINGKAKCPGCGVIYPRPIFAISGIKKRYERCPVCRKWHWTEKLGDPE
jgi:hypothetical protein